jgi:16S rRNA (guanine1207-N2)-methyltransferase
VAEDIFYKKTVILNAWGKSFKFRVSQELFSSHDIDVGTWLLLRTIVDSEYPKPRKILDMGCGYGPIGLTLKSLYQDSNVHMVDKDALAVEYSRQNAAINNLTGVNIYASLGYDDIRQTDFDLILSNIPGKAGEPVIASLLREARYYLGPSGLVAIVVVTPLADMVSQVLRDTNGVEVILKRTGPDHVVFHYRFSPSSDDQKPTQNALERGIYTRNCLKFHWDNLDYLMQTAYGLPEFDSLSYRSEITLKSISTLKMSDIGQTAILNPGQGHIAVLLTRLFQPSGIILVDRDLLALRTSKLNLSLNNYLLEKVDIRHQVGLNSPDEVKYGQLILSLREEEGSQANLLTLRQATERLDSHGRMLVTASSTAITRLAHGLRSIGLRTKERERWKGLSLLVLEPIS